MLILVTSTLGPVYKTLLTRNLRQMDIFHGKLMSFLLSVTKHISLDKHTSLLQNP